ncbi:ribonuclease H-like domain-containing protein [Tanacetum coccineum]
MEAGTTTTTLTTRLPILNPGDYDLWLMRIEQYFLMIDYSLWEVIKNGNKVLKKSVGNVKQVYEPTSTEEKLDRKNEMKARGTLLMALLNKDQLKFHSYQDAKLLTEAIEKRYGETRKSKKLEIQVEVIEQEDMNLKLLRRSTNTSQNSQNVAFMSSNSTNSNNSTNEVDNTTYGVSAAHTQSNPTSGDNVSDAVIYGIRGYDWSYQAKEEHPTNYALMAYASSGSSSSLDSEVDSCSKSCVKAYATLKEQYDSLSLDYKKSQFNLVSYKAGLESVEARLAHYKKNEAAYEESINVLNLEKFQNSSKTLNNLLESQVVNKFKTGLGYNATSSTAVESFVNTSEMLENQDHNKSKSDKGYHAVPPPFTGNFIPHKPDLTFMDEIVDSENMDVTTIVTPSNVKTVESNHESAGVKRNGDAVEPKTVRKNNFRPPVIEDWNSDDDSEVEFIPNVENKSVRPSTEKIEFAESARETPKQNKQYPRGNQRNWNNLMSQRLGSDFKMINKACFVCGGFEHLHYVCDKKVIRPVGNNSSRVNHKNFTNKMTHPHPNRRFVPQAVLTKYGKINTAGASVNTAVRPVNTAGSKPTVNHPRPISNAYKKGYSQVTRPFNKYSEYKNSIFNKKVNTVRVKDTTARDRAVVSENKGKGVNTVKASACWGNPQQKEYKEKGVIDSGCSRHMTGNKCYLTEYEDYDGGFVSFGDGKGRISGKGKIKTGTLDFENVYFCKELKYNLFSVSQICDKKNNVLFTDTECLVLSFDFKLLDESQVLLRVPRKDNIYSVDLKSVVPTKGLTCLFAKATIDESKLWHRRLGHINFKNMNKLVRGNLVRGLPSKIFENDHYCVAC